MFFANAMLAIDNNAEYADVIERVLYNGVLSGLSHSGKEFFYENPLEINLSEHFKSTYGERRFPAQRRVECFGCSCCPPNINRLLSSLGNYVYGIDGDTLYVNQYISSTVSCGGINATMTTEYPNKGTVKFAANGVSEIAFRIPSWCEAYSINKAYTLKNGYAIVENDGTDIIIEFAVTAKAIWADPRIFRDAGRVCFMRGPVVYCAEGVDNPHGLHSYKVLTDAPISEEYNEKFGLMTLTLEAERLLNFDGGLYSSSKPKTEKTALKLIPYSCFANRGESDMLVWLNN
jgi:DUF1680 family protein